MIKLLSLKLLFNPGEGVDLEFYCDSASFVNCNPTDQSVPAPPLDITIDYGDKSGVARWNEDSPVDIFQHVYSAPGTYHISIQSGYFLRAKRELVKKSLYLLIAVNTMDLRVNVLTVAVVIKGPTLNDFSPALNDVFRDEIELTCPLQAVPGSQFTCSIDIPRGNGVKVLLEMRDDIDGTTQVTTPEMAIPGGNIKTNFHILHNYPMILPRSVVGYSRRTPSHIHLRQRELQPHQERPGLPDQPQNVGQHLSRRGNPGNCGQLPSGDCGARVSR